MNATLRDARKTIERVGLIVVDCRTGGKRLHLVCRDPKNGYIGVIALHRGKKIKSFHLDAIRAEARNLRREGARA